MPPKKKKGKAKKSLPADEEKPAEDEEKLDSSDREVLLQKE